MKVPLNFNEKEFFEFIWQFERLQAQRQREHEEEQRDKGRMSFTNRPIRGRPSG